MLLQDVASSGAESDADNEGIKQLPNAITTSRVRRFVGAAYNTKSLAKPVYIVTSTRAGQQSRDNAQSA